VLHTVKNSITIAITLFRLNKNNMENEAWITVNEAAKYLRVSPGTIRNAQRRAPKDKEPMPFFKPGGRLMTKKSLLDQWIQQNPI
jgi:excisionase family DNA binding protein